MLTKSGKLGIKISLESIENMRSVNFERLLNRMEDLI
jgi:hypothetical protein